MIALVVVLIGAYVLAYTRFGRTVYAIGGNADSALLMGLPVAATKVAVYAVSGLCATGAGVLYTFYTGAGLATPTDPWTTTLSVPKTAKVEVLF